MGQGGIIDGFGNALYGEMTFKDGVPDKNNFHQYKMIRQKVTPRAVDVHFVKNEEEPTGLGEPLFPPVFAAVANALYKATEKRFYDQAFVKHIETNPSRM
jgi:isoquinoline 1-oxidoreductase beta subunit